MTLSVCEDLYDESIESFILVLVFSVLDLGALVICFIFLFIFWIFFKLCRQYHISFKVFGCLPLFYKILVNIGYVSLFILTIIMFSNYYEDLPDLVISFLIYQMIVGFLLILLEIYDLVKMQTTSQFIFDIQTENEIYSVDDKEIELWKKEYQNARKMFKGTQD